MSTVERLRPLFEAAWGPDTCDPHDLAAWRPGNPSRGQCGPTALVLQDLLGGDLVLGRGHVDGRQVGHHWWNRLPDGAVVDLTADQFRPEETVVGGEVRHRPPGAPGRCRGQYELLGHRVRGPARPPVSGDPVRIAVVALTDSAGRLLLHLRAADAAAEPGQWALPGGHVEPGETPAEAAARELREETGLVADGLRPTWTALRPDLTGAAPCVEVHAFAGRTIATTNGQDARFVREADLPQTDLSPTAAAVLHATWISFGSGSR
ncbi:YunG family protein [Asanoa siamensis]|nr:NUDIX hydrolase [Asanoa siamensis]